MHLYKNTLFSIQRKSFAIPVEVAGIFTNAEIIEGKIEYARLSIYKDAKLIAIHEARVADLVKYLRIRYGVIVTSVSHET